MEKIKLLPESKTDIIFTPAHLDQQHTYQFERQVSWWSATTSALPFALLITKIIIVFIGWKEGWHTVAIVITPCYFLLVLAFYFFMQQELMINQYGITWFRRHKKIKNVQWSDIKETYVVIEGNYHQPKAIIKEKRLITFDQVFWKGAHGYTILDVISSYRPDMQVKSIREIAKADAAQDIGKNSGKATAFAVVGLLVGALIVYIDPYFTITLGVFSYINMMWAALGFTLAFWMIKSSFNMMGAKILIALLCAGAMFFAGSQLTLAVLSQVTPETTQSFTLISKNKRANYEYWKSGDQLELDCILTPRPIGTIKNAEVIQMGGLARLRFTDVCIPARDL